MKAVAAFKRHKADRIVATKNQGGLMVESTLRAVDRSVPVRLVNASRGNYVRAEPVSAFYEQHRIHHAGCFPELEDEMCSFEPGSTDSPDRMDALVSAITDLMLGHQQMVGFHPPFAPTVPRYTGNDLPPVIASAAYGDGGCDKPGGYSADDPRAGGGDPQFGWSHLGRG